MLKNYRTQMIVLFKFENFTTGETYYEHMSKWEAHHKLVALRKELRKNVPFTLRHDFGTCGHFYIYDENGRPNMFTYQAHMAFDVPITGMVKKVAKAA